MPKKATTRIQVAKREIILDAALSVFSAHGYNGATLDRIAEEAHLSKPNLLYYFDSKEAIHQQLLTQLLDSWLEPLKAIDPEGEPIEELLGYMTRKLEMSQTHPRESRLFANEILQGAIHIQDQLSGPLQELVDQKARVIRGWASAGKINYVDPQHLIFSIWATTQHYADFDVQVRLVMGNRAEQRFSDAKLFLTNMYTRLLIPARD